MNEIELLMRRIISRLPLVDTYLDRPKDPNGVWTLDIKLGEHWIIVDWKPKQDFGISDCSNGKTRCFGDGPDEFIRGIENALQRVTELLSK